MKAIVKKLLRKIGHYIQKWGYPFENFFIRGIISFRQNFVLSYMPFYLTYAIARLYPKLGLVLFTIQAKHNWSFYYHWYNFTTAFQRLITEPLKNNIKVDDNLFLFVLGGIQSPALLQPLLLIIPKLTPVQKKGIEMRVKEIYKKLTFENKVLFSKQLIYLSISNDGTHKTFDYISELINENAPELDCSLHLCSKQKEAPLQLSENIKMFEAEETLVDINNTISHDGNYLLLNKIHQATNENFNIHNYFINSNGRELIHLRKRNTNTHIINSPCGYFIFPLQEKNKFRDFLFHLESLYLISHYSKVSAIVLNNSSDHQLKSFLQEQVLNNIKFAFNSNYCFKKLTILEKKDPTVFEASAGLKNYILHNIQMNHEAFKNKFVVLTNTLPPMSEVERTNLKNMVRKSDGIFIDVEIAKFKDFLSIFVSAKIIICGLHPLLNLDFLRPNSDTVYVFEKDQIKEKNRPLVFHDLDKLEEIAFSNYLSLGVS